MLKDLNNYTIIINGNNEYISEINDKINKINPDKINIIDCYSINDKNIEPQRIKEKYDDILNIIKDENGNIKMVGTNIFTVNKIISDIPVYMQEEFEREENSTFKIPIGSFFGSKLFSGRGPKVNIKMQIVGDLDTDLRSEFTSAGINQTLHRIYLEIKCNVVILTPFETIEQKISNQVLLAEGVIVGEIPNSYYNLEGISKDNAIDIIE